MKSYKVTIITDSLCREKWNIIYKIISSFYNGTLTVDTLTKYCVWKKQSWTDRKRIYISNTEYADGNVHNISISEIPFNEKEVTFFTIIYEKQDAKEDLSELAYFALLDDEQNEKKLPKVALGINIEKLSYQEQQGYKFKLFDFFRFQSYLKKDDTYWKSIFTIPSQVYLINLKIEEDNGRIKQIRSSALPYSAKGQDEKDSSRMISPLLKIGETSFNEIFGYKKSKKYTSPEANYFLETLSKIPKYSKETTGRLFERWFISSFYNSLEEIPQENEREPLNRALRSYSNYIYELVQNFIFHTKKKEGFLYIIFNKKKNIPVNRLHFVPYFDTYTDMQRFVEIGIFDRNDVGVVQNYNQQHEEDTRSHLLDFYNQEPSISRDLSHLHLRHLAHLGIKTFVKSIISHNGYFWVESNKLDSTKGVKQVVETYFNTQIDKITVKSVSDVSFIDGTHYEIIIPVKPEEVTPPQSLINMQSKSFIEKLRDCHKIPHIKLITMDIRDFGVISKKEQEELIESKGEEIIRQSGDASEIALDIRSGENEEVDVNLLFKILSYVQFGSKKTIETILLVKLQDEFIKRICDLIYDLLKNCQPFWSSDAAVILISKNFHYQIICGGKISTANYLNEEYHKFYPQGRNYFVGDRTESEENLMIKNRFVSPYEMWIADDNGISLFESNVTELLNRPIEFIGVEETGYKLDVHTYIGNKLILNHFYEADSLFQNSFYAQRFAYPIAKKVYDSFTGSEKKLVLVGYKHYSELLVHSVKEILLYLFKLDKEKHKLQKNKSKLPEDSIDILVCIAHEKDNNKFYFAFENEKDKTIMDSQAADYFYAIIIPIGSTLSTNDKVIAFFKRSLKCDISDRIFYNHCVILIRDRDNADDITELESRQNWYSIDKVNKVVRTNYHNLKDRGTFPDKDNRKDINYSILISEKTNHSGSGGLWSNLLNDKISFPKEWWKEKYVNSTENSSINSQNLMGLPYVHEYREYRNAEDIKSDTRTIHEINLDRLKEFKQDIKYGHIESFNTHFQYYFDTKGYLNRCYHLKSSSTESNETEFEDWLNTLRKQECYKNQRLSVIVTPNTELQSHFVNIINAELFGNLAFVLFVDINNWRNNIIYKLSFLKSYKDVDYHYVDHALRTGERFNKTKSYLHSIIDSNNAPGDIFKSAIVLINNLSYNKNKEILRDTDGNLFAFIDFFVPPTQESGKECILCTQRNYYEKILYSSALESCRSILSDKIAALEISKEYILESHRNILSDEIEENAQKLEKEFRKISINDDKFDKLIYTHDIFFELSDMRLDKDVNSENCKEKIRDRLDKLLEGYYIRENDTAKRQKKKTIFFDAITSLPLSRYIHIREYAHSKLLNELSIILRPDDYPEINIQYDNDTFHYLKNILLYLSRLKSSALVRKDVIIGVWDYFYRVYYCKINEEIEISSAKTGAESVFTIELRRKRNEIISDIITLKKEFQYYIKCAITNDETKSMFLGELLRTGNEMVIDSGIHDEFAISGTTTNNDLFKSFDKEEFKFPDTNDSLRKHFREFLVLLFFDNTAIFRNTLQNFGKDIPQKIRKYVNDTLSNSKTPFDFNQSIDELILSANRALTTKINGEYYYSHFKPYLRNGDGIKISERLLYVVTARIMLSTLIDKFKGAIDSDLNIDSCERSIAQLLYFLSKIMCANDAFLTVKNNDNSLYLFSSTNISSPSDSVIPKDYYTWKIFNTDEEIYSNKSFAFPFIFQDLIDNRDNISYGETRYGEIEQYSYCDVLLIYGNNTQLNGTITFLYDDVHSSTYEYNRFRIRCREYERLLLLLKNEISEYFRLENWALCIEKIRTKRKDDKLYEKSDHFFIRDFESMDVFDEKKYDYEQIKELSPIWYTLADKCVHFLYSNVYNNHSIVCGKHIFKLDVSADIIYDESSTLGCVFDDRFNEILNALHEKRWKRHPEIRILKSSDFDGNTRIYIKKNILRSYIALCIDNSLNKHSYKSCTTQVTLYVSNSFIRISDELKGNTNEIEKALERDYLKFNNNKSAIESLNCFEYSSTTYTSLRAIVNWLNAESNGLKIPLHYDIVYGYGLYGKEDDKYNFNIKIIYETKNN